MSGIGPFLSPTKLAGAVNRDAKQPEREGKRRSVHKKEIQRVLDIITMLRIVTFFFYRFCSQIFFFASSLQTVFFIFIFYRMSIEILKLFLLTASGNQSFQMAKAADACHNEKREDRTKATFPRG